MMKLTQTSSVSISVSVYDPLKGRKNPRSRYYPTISGRLSVGDFVYMAPSATANDDDCSSVHSKILTQFRSKKTFGQVMKLYNKKTADDDEEDVLLDINLYLKRENLPSSLGRFNSRVPQRNKCWSKRTFALKTS
jgi:hypothetical protein